MWIVSSRAHRKQIVSTRADSSDHSIAPPNPEPIVSRAGVSRAGVSAASCRTIEIDRALPTRAVLELSRAKQRAELPALGLCCSATHSIAQQRESHICAPGSMSRLPRCHLRRRGIVCPLMGRSNGKNCKKIKKWQRNSRRKNGLAWISSCRAAIAKPSISTVGNGLTDTHARSRRDRPPPADATPLQSFPIFILILVTSGLSAPYGAHARNS